MSSSITSGRGVRQPNDNDKRLQEHTGTTSSSDRSLQPRAPSDSTRGATLLTQNQCSTERPVTVSATDSHYLHHNVWLGIMPTAPCIGPQWDTKVRALA